jgi:hypothetical protein
VGGRRGDKECEAVWAKAKFQNLKKGKKKFQHHWSLEKCNEIK